MADAQNSKEATKKETTVKETTIKETTTQTTGLPPVTAETPIIKFDISINKTSPATPGDKYFSKIMESDPVVADKYQLWGKRQLSQEFPLKLGNDTIVCEQEKIDKKLSDWDGEEPIAVMNRFYDIVPYAGLIKQPLWHAKVKTSRDGIPLVSDQKTSTSPAVPGERTDNRIPVRIDAFLSFDSEEWYAISPYNKWPEDIKKKRGKEYIKDIYQAISKDEKDIINELIDNKVISHSAKRLTLDNIVEGEWLLPVYVWDGKDKGTKKLLAYVTVIIGWTSEGAKATDKTGQ